MSFSLSIPPLRRFLELALLLLVVAGVWVELGSSRGGGSLALSEVLGLGSGGALPRWYGSCLWFTCALLIAGVALGEAAERSEWTRHWWGLAAASMVFSLDGALGFVGGLREGMVAAGLSTWARVLVPGVILTLPLLGYRRFREALHEETAIGIQRTAVLVLAGLLGGELMAGSWAELAGTSNAVHTVLALLAEAAQLAGASVLLLTTARHMGERWRGAELIIVPEQSGVVDELAREVEEFRRRVG